MSTFLSKKGKVLSAQTRAIVFSVLQFALREKKAKSPLLDINKAMDRVAAMTGLCRDTLSKIKKEGSSNGGVWETKVKKKRQKVITNPNDVDKINIINKIEEFNKRNEAVSLRKLLKELKQENNFSGGKTSLLIVLNSMGYKWEKTECNKKVLQKISKLDAVTTSRAKQKNTQSDSITEPNIPMQRIPQPILESHPPEFLQPHGSPDPFTQRPLLHNGPQYICNL